MMLREEKKLATWRAIRSAALSLFETHGYEATTVEQIAVKAQVSRATFFNYFAGKEAALFDEDPGERDTWRATMDRRPSEEPLWSSLCAILLDLNEGLRDRMPLQRRLKAASPALARHSQAFGERLRADLEAWVVSRPHPDRDELSARLQLNLALAAMATAYQSWPQHETFDDYMTRLENCLRKATPAASS